MGFETFYWKGSLEFLFENILAAMVRMISLPTQNETNR